MAYANPTLVDKTAFLTVWKDGTVTVWTVLEAQQARRNPDWHAEFDLRPVRVATPTTRAATVVKRGKRSRIVGF